MALMREGEAVIYAVSTLETVTLRDLKTTGGNRVVEIELFNRDPATSLYYTLTGTTPETDGNPGKELPPRTGRTSKCGGNTTLKMISASGAVNIEVTPWENA